MSTISETVVSLLPDPDRLTMTTSNRRLARSRIASRVARATRLRTRWPARAARTNWDPPPGVPCASCRRGSPAGARTARVDCQHRDPVTLGGQVHPELVDEGGLADAGTPSDRCDQPSRVSGISVVSRSAAWSVFGLAAFDQRDRARQPHRVARTHELGQFRCLNGRLMNSAVRADPPPLLRSRCRAGRSPQRPPPAIPRNRPEE